MNCINCGAPINPHKENCQFCGTYYDVSKFNIFKSKKIRKTAIYPFFLISGIVVLLLNYAILFDSLSETALVRLTPVWFFSIIMGMYGYKAEVLINDIVSGKASTFNEAYRNWLKRLATTNILASFLVSILFFTFPFFKKITPLQTALTGALVWGVLLLIFFEGIFPGL